MAGKDAARRSPEGIARRKIASRSWPSTAYAVDREYKLQWCGKRRDWLTEQKRNKPCADCGGVFHPAAMHFHHRSPETKSFALGAKVCNRSCAALKDEIAKCDLICANCHAIRTWA